MNEQYTTLNAQIDALYAQLQADDGSDAQAYEQTAEALVSLQGERDELLAGLLLERYNTRFTTPIDRARSLEMARHANEQRDNRLWLKEV